MLYNYGDWSNYNEELPNIWQLYQSGAKVINGSWFCSCETPNETDQLAINEMYENGIVLVFTAGNRLTCTRNKNRPKN